MVIVTAVDYFPFFLAVVSDALHWCIHSFFFSLKRAFSTCLKNMIIILFSFLYFFIFFTGNSYIDIMFSEIMRKWDDGWRAIGIQQLAPETKVPILAPSIAASIAKQWTNTTGYGDQTLPSATCSTSENAHNAPLCH